MSTNIAGSGSEVHASTPKRTALYEEHAALGASFTDFGGWDMPLKYGSELAEHRAVREAAGLFDLSHMGEIWVEGADAGTYLNTALVGNLTAVAIGKAKYSLLCDERGGIIDDVICYRLHSDQYLVVPNAGNIEAVVSALAARSAGFDVEARDASASTSLIAVQGPRAAQVLHEVIRVGVGVGSADADADADADARAVKPAGDATSVESDARAALDALPYYAACTLTIAGVEALVARTGYTGEDGFELFVSSADAVALWRALLEAGSPLGLIPAGLASRDSLRLEAGMPLYGNELSREVTPLQAGLGGVVSFKKPERFVGRDALEAEREVGPATVLVGLQGLGRRAARSGYPVYTGEMLVGRVTSGQPSPTLGTPIALALVTPECAAPGTAVEVDLRGKREAFTVVAPPFYRRAS